MTNEELEKLHERLIKIHDIADFDYSQLCREYPFVQKHVSRGDSIYPAIAGIMQSELEIVINSIVVEVVARRARIERRKNND